MPPEQNEKKINALRFIIAFLWPITKDFQGELKQLGI